MLRQIVGGSLMTALLMLGAVLVIDGRTSRADEGSASGVIRTDSDVLRVGACIQLPDPTTAAPPEAVSCDEMHDAQVYADFDAPSAGGQYPGDAQLGSIAANECRWRFDDATGMSYELADDVDFAWLVPSPSDWDQGERSVTCVVTQSDGSAWMGSRVIAS